MSLAEDVHAELLRICPTLQDSFPLFSSLAFQGNSPDAPSNLPKLSCGIASGEGPLREERADCLPTWFFLPPKEKEEDT